MTMPPPVLEAASLASLLQSGRAAVIPTDTVVGLAVRPDDAGQIWTLKRRPADKPLILMAATVEALFAHVDGCCHAAASDYAITSWKPPLDPRTFPLADGGHLLCSITQGPVYHAAPAQDFRGTHLQVLACRTLLDP